jgi:hypothetical protein
VTDPVPYAFLVEEALQFADSQIVATLVDSRFDLRRMLLVSPDQHIGLASLEGHAIPDALTTPVTVHELHPGALHFDLATPSAAPSYLFVSENFHPAWHATVDASLHEGSAPNTPLSQCPPAGALDRATFSAPDPAGRGDHAARAAARARHGGG